MHLYCLERFTDFIRICQELHVEADARDLPWEERGKNPFQLSTPAEEKCVRGFIRACQAGNVPLDYPRFEMPDRPHEGTLTHRLACVKLKRESCSVGKQRELRERAAGYRGSTLDVHVGDLEVEARVRSWTRCHKNQNQLVVRPRVPRKYQGVCFVRGAEGEDDGEGEDEDAEGEVEDGGDEGAEPAWVAAAREPVFGCQSQKRIRGKKRSSVGALDDRTAAKKVESSDDDDSAEDEDESDADALEQQKLELKLTELKKKQMIKAGKRTQTEAESEDEDDDVVVPSRKRPRK